MAGQLEVTLKFTADFDEAEKQLNEKFDKLSRDFVRKFNAELTKLGAIIDSKAVFDEKDLEKAMEDFVKKYSKYLTESSKKSFDLYSKYAKSGYKNLAKYYAKVFLEEMKKTGDTLDKSLGPKSKLETLLDKYFELDTIVKMYDEKARSIYNKYQELRQEAESKRPSDVEEKIEAELRKIGLSLEAIFATTKIMYEGKGIREAVLESVPESKRSEIEQKISEVEDVIREYLSKSKSQINEYVEAKKRADKVYEKYLRLIEEEEKYKRKYYEISNKMFSIYEEIKKTGRCPAGIVEASNKYDERLVSLAKEIASGKFDEKTVEEFEKLIRSDEELKSKYNELIDKFYVPRPATPGEDLEGKLRRLREAGQEASMKAIREIAQQILSDVEGSGANNEEIRVVRFLGRVAESFGKVSDRFKQMFNFSKFYEAIGGVSKTIYRVVYDGVLVKMSDKMAEILKRYGLDKYFGDKESQKKVANVLKMFGIEKKSFGTIASGIVSIMMLFRMLLKMGEKFSGYARATNKLLDTMLNLALMPIANMIGMVILPILMWMLKHILMPMVKLWMKFMEWIRKSGKEGFSLGGFLGAVAGGAVGIMAGTKIGGLIGGAVFGPIGAILGMVIGALLGAVAEKIIKKLKEFAEKVVHMLSRSKSYTIVMLKAKAIADYAMGMLVFIIQAFTVAIRALIKYVAKGVARILKKLPSDTAKRWGKALEEWSNFKIFDTGAYMKYFKRANVALGLANALESVKSIDDSFTAMKLIGLSMSKGAQEVIQKWTEGEISLGRLVDKIYELGYEREDIERAGKKAQEFIEKFEVAFDGLKVSVEEKNKILNDVLDKTYDKVLSASIKARDAWIGAMNAVIENAKAIKQWLEAKKYSGAPEGEIVFKKPGGEYIAMRQFGGEIPETGTYLLHKGELVIPSWRVPQLLNSGGQVVNVSVNVNVERMSSDLDVRRLADEISEIIMRRIRWNTGSWG